MYQAYYAMDESGGDLGRQAFESFGERLTHYHEVLLHEYARTPPSVVRSEGWNMFLCILESAYGLQ